MNNKRRWVIGGIVLLVIFSLIGLSLQGSKGNQAPAVKRAGVIAVVRIDGMISDAGKSTPFGAGSGGPRLLEELRALAADDSVKAVVLRINSPGGSASTSQEIGDQIDLIRKNGKAVVTSMGEIAASGGYWIAAKSDQIVANPATLTGSIGVIMEFAQLTELYNKIGYESRVIKSGPHKDIGSSAREITPEEYKILQSMIDDIYEQFIDVVAAGRKMTREQVKALADGRIFTGRQAKEAGLVDRLGNYYDAIEVARQLAGIQGQPEIREYGRKSTLEQLLSDLPGTMGNNTLPAGLQPGDLERLIELLGLEKSNFGGVK